MDYFSSPPFSFLVERLMKQHHVPGLAIGIVQDESIASKGYGSAHLEPSRKCTPDTLFDIASSSKVLTAAAVGLLVEDNDKYPDVQWDAAISDLLPDDFVMSDDRYTKLVTVEDILSHRTGMPGHDNSILGPRAAQPDNARSITRNLRNLSMAAPLRTRYLYCNMMYTVATHLIEVKSQQTFSEFLQQCLFQTLGMQSTTLQPENARSRGLGDVIATGYCWNKANVAYDGFPNMDCPEGQGAGSVVTSVNDFIKFVKALMNHEDPLSGKLYESLVRMRTFKNPDAKRLKRHTSPVAYAAGLDVWFYRDHKIVGHDGMISGFSSRFFFIPDMKFGCVILGNSTGVSNIGGILARELIDEVIEVPRAERVHRNPGQVLACQRTIDRSAHPKTPTQAQMKHKAKSRRQLHDSQDSHAQAPQPQERPLDAYTGKFTNLGYHSLVVEIRSGKLFINATERSMGFTLTFEHVSDQTSYIAHLSDFWEGGDDPVEAQFSFQDGRAVRLGLNLEPALKEKIWFDRDKDG